jgi:alkyl hydroperoxide reductase subunit AhpC
VIDPNKKVRLILTYPPSTGRNFAEILRSIDSLQLTDARGVSTPVNWNPGDRVVISPKLSDEEALAKFPQGFETKKPYLRLVDLG